MSVKYHIVPETGEPKPCKAVDACPIGGNHYATEGEARRSFELEMSAISIPEPVAKTREAVNIFIKESQKEAEPENKQLALFNPDNYTVEQA